VIIFGSAAGLMRVSAGGGSASPLTRSDPARQEARHVLPWFLPDGRHFLYLRVSATPENSGIYKLQQPSIKGLSEECPIADEEQISRVWVRRWYIGWPILARHQSFRTLLFWLGIQRAYDGEPAPLAEGLGSFIDFAYFHASTNGVLVFRVGGGSLEQLAWYDRQGKVLGTAGEPVVLDFQPHLSPDGTHATVSSVNFQQGAINAVIWLLDFSRGTSTRFTFGPASAQSAVWSPDGSRIIFASVDREGKSNLYQKLASGAGDDELLLKSNEDKYPRSWSRDGRFLLYTATRGPKTTKDKIWVLPLEGDKKPFPFLRTDFNEEDGQFSPDGHWIAYSSDESGRQEIYVSPFSPNPNGTASAARGKWLISTGGGVEPQWRGDGRELYYLAPDGKLMAVDVTTKPVFQAGAPKSLFQTPPAVSAVGR